MNLTTGQTFEVHINHGIRMATVLAVVGNKALVEYEMPGESTGLWLVDSQTQEYIRRIPYARVSSKWLETMIHNKIEWIGRPQKGRFIPSVKAMYRRKGA